MTLCAIGGDSLICENDELKIYRGEDFVISEHIIIHQPTLDEICRYGEKEYYFMVHQLTATPQSMKWQLWDIGIDYTKITPFELFYTILYKLYPQNKTSIIFGDLDFMKFKLFRHRENDSLALCQIINNNEVIIDEFTYTLIMDYLRKIHYIDKDEKMPANESTKMALIEDDRENYERNKTKEYHSYLKNLISTMINSSGFKYNHSQVWDMKINAFMDSVKRITKIKNVDLLLQSGYSGYGIDLSKIKNKKEQLDWFGELD